MVTFIIEGALQILSVPSCDSPWPGDGLMQASEQTLWKPTDPGLLPLAMVGICL